ncbi:hypothetical protein llap_15799 [Limosa lapponica baueri]|uniref:Uncharacterized protein n=1 Tax=Limosa lapponica baueri TaxID=1758121 RepID=A0A2I0TJB8_LIMLA|nr:hypothetical protein llap_15799 [Limosa lapponica baueri]
MDKRIVSEKWGSPFPTSPGFGIGSEEEEEEEEADHMFTFRMGKRMQLAVTMDNKAKGKRIVSEKRAECFPGPGRVPDLSEEETDHLVAFRRGRRMQIAITMDNKEKVSALRMTVLQFEEDFVKDGEPALDNPSNKKGGGQHGVNVSDPGAKAVPAVSSRAKGKDRLTGRARREYHILIF